MESTLAALVLHSPKIALSLSFSSTYCFSNDIKVQQYNWKEKKKKEKSERQSNDDYLLVKKSYDANYGPSQPLKLTKD